MHCLCFKLLGEMVHVTFFFQNCWFVVKPNLLEVFGEFYHNVKIGACMSSTFITLVPNRIGQLKLRISTLLAWLLVFTRQSPKCLLPY